MRLTTPAYWPYWLLVVASGLPYLILALSYKRILNQRIEETVARLTKDTREAYAKAYGNPDIKDALKQWYHWTTFVAPLLLAFVVAGALTAVALAVAGLPLPGLPGPLVTKMASTPLAVLAGALGAFLFGLDDVVRRHAIADLSPAALHAAWLRIAIASGVGAVFNGMHTPEALAIPLAFAVGTLPLSEIWVLVREKANVKYNPGKAWEPDLHLLQGLTRSARDRLIEEDIDSVQRLADIDPIRLLCRTNLEWNVILDMLDQALLVDFVGEKITALRVLGVRGAIEMSDYAERSIENGNTKAEVAHGERMLAEIGAALGTSRDAAFNISYALSNDALVQFVWAQWESVFGEDDDDRAA
jgi:hypothetical protein